MTAPETAHLRCRYIAVYIVTEVILLEYGGENDNVSAEKLQPKFTTKESLIKVEYNNEIITHESFCEKFRKNSKICKQPLKRF